MNEEEDEFDYKTLLIVILLYFPAALADSIDYFINGTSLGYRLFSNGLFNPIWGFWGGLIGTIVEIYLIYYFRKKFFNWLKSWYKGKPKTRQTKLKGKKIFISYAIQDSERLKIASISKKLSTLPLIENVFCWELWDGYPNGNIIEFMENGIENSDIFIPCMY